MNFSRGALIGFGEVGQILGADLPKHGASNLSAWDVKFSDPESEPSRAAAKSQLRMAEDAGDAVRGADIVISAVTAAQAVEAAKNVVIALAPGAFFLDLNSASPGAKTSAARIVAAVKGRYVEAAVMSPFPPKRLGTSLLLGGPHAEAFAGLAPDLGFSDAVVFSAEYGKAAAAKMCRSVMVKGIEALLGESLLTARRFGVEDTVLSSLSDLFPGPDWSTLARYMISRSLAHGVRRAEEMREAAKTVEEAGVSPLMSTACAERQALAAAFSDAASARDLCEMLDDIRNGAASGRRL